MRNRGLEFNEYINIAREHFEYIEESNISGHLLYSQMLWGENLICNRKTIVLRFEDFQHITSQNCSTISLTPLNSNSSSSGCCFQNSDDVASA